VDMTNPDISLGGSVVLPRGTVHIARTKFLWEAGSYERLCFSNHGMHPVDLSVTIRFEADFADIFEVRGVERARKGRFLPDRFEEGAVVLSYHGLHGVILSTRIECRPAPIELSAARLQLGFRLEPHEIRIHDLTIACRSGPAPSAGPTYDEAVEASERTSAAAKSRCPTIISSDAQFNEWLDRSLADIRMMTTDLPTGPYPFAGVPWFSTPFGRDGIITALELLWLNPQLARGVLAYLVSTQATAEIPREDAEPGKILHESRRGEMAELGEIPFGRYYGSADSTPLFVLLAGAYLERTGDLEFIRSIWRSIELALRWVDEYGDRDGDGFVEYLKQSPNGLVHQGWKDSQDAVFHSDGRLAEGPIALCEVQGYVHDAKLRAAEMALALGIEDRARELTRQAGELRERFERAFWCEDLSTYALALDGEKRACQVRASNAGHCLFSRIATGDHARRAAHVLLGPSSFSGWGIRTLDEREARYNPMAYHNGSVWPHDNALIGLGLARYGLRDLVTQVATGLFEASVYINIHRLPELFCGFRRRPGEGPTLYPVACSPQAWSAGSVFMILQALLGLTIRGAEKRVEFRYARLPDYLAALEIRDLRVGEASVDLRLERHTSSVGVNVLRKEGEVEIVALK
jgi:glycogen debranching enzyme